MSKMTIFGIVAIIALAGSFVWNGFKTPELSDEEYIRQYKILNVNSNTDEEIIKQRRNHEIDSMKWKHTNKLLEDEMKARGINEKAGQTALLQIQFYDAYYNHNVDVKRFVDLKYKD